VELTNEFRVGVPVEQAWAVLTDLERIAPCMPGAELQEVEGDEYRGIVKVKVGPITAQYKGAASFVEVDAPHRAVLRAEGRETRGQGGASALVTAVLVPDGDATKVTVSTELTVTGKVAQFGRGVLADVSAKLLTQFVECLEATVLGAQDPSEATPAAAVADEAGEAAVAAANAGAEAPAAADAATSEETPPGVRRIESAPKEPVDLVGAAGVPVAKRVAPAVAILAVLWLLRVLLRRRKR
jgi:carbon monoxide dehydrogenase subunit G